MRLARLVAAGLVLGAFAGFIGALLRPRSVPGAAAADPVGNPARSGIAAAGSGPDPAPGDTATRLHAIRPAAMSTPRPPGTRRAPALSGNDPDRADDDPDRADDEGEPALSGSGGAR